MSTSSQKAKNALDRASMYPRNFTALALESPKACLWLRVVFACVLWGQAAEAGVRLREVIGDESVYFMVSPYTRTRMTYEIVRDTLNPKTWAAKEDPRLRGRC